jgi:hypothetical protein
MPLSGRVFLLGRIGKALMFRLLFVSSESTKPSCGIPRQHKRSARECQGPSAAAAEARAFRGIPRHDFFFHARYQKNDYLSMSKRSESAPEEE